MSTPKKPKPLTRAQKQALERMGGRETTVKEFLGLTDHEAALVELRLQLADYVREYRKKHGLTQTQLAKLVGSTQARIAKIEAGDPQASLDAIVRALTATGAKLELKVA